MSITLPAAINPRDWQEGPANAPVTLVEYGDFQCGDCREAFFALKSLREQQGERMRFVYRHLPLTDVHERALYAAKAAEVAGAHGQFWAMHDLLYGGQASLTHQDIVSAAVQVGVDADAFTEEAEGEQAYAAVRADVDGIRATGLHHTPSLFLNGVLYTGQVSLAALSAAIATLATP